MSTVKSTCSFFLTDDEFRFPWIRVKSDVIISFKNLRIYRTQELASFAIPVKNSRSHSLFFGLLTSKSKSQISRKQGLMGPLGAGIYPWWNPLWPVRWGHKTYCLFNRGYTLG